MDSIDSGDPLSYSLLQLLQVASSYLHIEYLIALAAGISLLLLSALTSGAEAAFFSLSEQEIARCKTSSHAPEQQVYNLLQTPRKLLTNILVLNNGINVSIITLFAYMAWQLWGTTAFSVDIIIAGALLTTFLLVFFGEVLPKVYAQKQRLLIAKRIAPFLKVTQVITFPLARLLIFFSTYIEKHYHIRGYNHTIEDLHHSLDVALTNEDSSPEERRILRGVVSFSSISVRQIMRPRVDIAAFSTQATLPELLPQIVQLGYSRVPVYAESTDKIEGILYVKDLLPYLNEKADFKWQQLIRPPFFVPESQRISDLFQDFKEKHVHMAVVVNEYGATSGLLTLEDIVEEIVGEINDEFDDDEDIIYSQLDEDTFIFDGKTSLHDLCKIMEVPFDSFNQVKGENETIAGLMLVLFSRIPRPGETSYFGRFHFTVESADSKRVKRVKINVATKKEHYHKVG